MRIGILANSLAAARGVYDEAKAAPGSEVFVLLLPTGDSPASSLMRHFARLIVKPGRWKSLRMIASRRVVSFRKPLTDSETIARLRQMQLDVGLHKSGNIYRRETIECFRVGILNAHIGLLPAYRGRSVMEWSLVQGDPCGVSVFFVDEGIDTGKRIVLSEAVDISHCRTVAEAKQYLFELDATFYRRALEQLQHDDETFQGNDGSGRRYYVMSKLFQDIVEEHLRGGNTENVRSQI
jgi:methionyl-tRNA formyltransferase